MAINIPIVTEFVDSGLKSAQGAFDNFRTKIGEADGAMGKFKAGSGAALDAVKANIGTLAVAGGAALATFAAKSVMAFNDLALSAGKFADATGLSAEESSRWTEVAGDLGVEADTVQKAIDRMNKSIATGSDEFKELGAEIAYTSAGAVDVNKTFLNTIDALNRIQDPTKRAELAAKTLGKGWQDMSELIAQGSASLTDSLAAVSDAKVIDEEEVRRAREFRAALDELADQGQDLGLALGEALIPILTDLLGVLGSVINAVKSVAGVFGEVFDFLSGDGLETMVDQIKAQEELNSTLADQYNAYYSSRRAAVALTNALENHKSITQEVDEQWQELLGTIDDQEAWNNLIRSLNNVEEASYQALVEGTAESAMDAQDAVGDLTRDVYDYIQQLGDIPPKVQTQILGLLDRGSFQEALDIINNLRSGAQVPITGQPGAYNPPAPGGQTGGGGVIRNPFLPGVKFAFSPMSNTTAGVTVNVAGSVVTERDLVESVRKGLVNSQRNGSGLVYTNQ
jgi:hypothetical protein